MPFGLAQMGETADSFHEDWWEEHVMKALLGAMIVTCLLSGCRPKVRPPRAVFKPAVPAKVRVRKAPISRLPRRPVTVPERSRRSPGRDFAEEVAVEAIQRSLGGDDDPWK